MRAQAPSCGACANGSRSQAADTPTGGRPRSLGMENMPSIVARSRAREGSDVAFDVVRLLGRPLARA